MLSGSYFRVQCSIWAAMRSGTHRVSDSLCLSLSHCQNRGECWVNSVCWLCVWAVYSICETGCQQSEAGGLVCHWCREHIVSYCVCLMCFGGLFVSIFVIGLVVIIVLSLTLPRLLPLLFVCLPCFSVFYFLPLNFLLLLLPSFLFAG